MAYSYLISFIRTNERNKHNRRFNGQYDNETLVPQKKATNKHSKRSCNRGSQECTKN